jgi:hypothetical protein
MLRCFFGLSQYITVNQRVFSRVMKLCLTLPSGEMWSNLLIFLGRIMFFQNGSKFFPSIRCHIPEDWSVMCVVLGLFGALHCHIVVSCLLLPMLRNVKFEHFILISVLYIDLKSCVRREWSLGNSAFAGSDFSLVKFPPSFIWNRRTRKTPWLTVLKGSTRPTAWWRSVRTSAAPCRILKWLTSRTAAQCRHILIFNVQSVLLPATQLAAALWYREVVSLLSFLQTDEQAAEPMWVIHVVPRVWIPSYSVYFIWQPSVVTSCRQPTTPTVIRAAEQQGYGSGVGQRHSNDSCIFVFFTNNF